MNKQGAPGQELLRFKALFFWIGLVSPYVCMHSLTTSSDNLQLLVAFWRRQVHLVLMTKLPDTLFAPMFGQSLTIPWINIMLVRTHMLANIPIQL